MKEYPILFSGARVRAILDNKKTQTRRVVKPPPDGFEWAHKKPGDVHWWEDWNSEREQWERHELPIMAHCLCYAGHIERCVNPLRDLTSRPAPWESSPFDCPYGEPGDRLWVRETWVNNFGQLLYRADCHLDSFEYGARGWKPGIHMPRVFSRITLENAAVRVERLQDISYEDIFKEGAPVEGQRPSEARQTFARLWDEINPKHSWSSNPWVWVVEFKQVTP